MRLLAILLGLLVPSMLFADELRWIDGGISSAQAVQKSQTVAFRRVIEIVRPTQIAADESVIDVAAVGSFTLWVNGTKVGNGKNSDRVQSFDIKQLMVGGNNVVAIEVSGETIGLIARINYTPNGQTKLSVLSDGRWRASRQPEVDWRKREFDDRKWSFARVLERSPTGKEPDWTGADGMVASGRFRVPPGFRVEEVVSPKPESIFKKYKQLGATQHLSLVNMCFDARGRLLVSQERGPILLCTDPDKSGVFQKIQSYCDLVTNCQGMCWIKESLYLVGDGPAAEGEQPTLPTKVKPGTPAKPIPPPGLTGLWRCKDTNGDDKIDTVELLHRFKGGMAEHGPHAVLHGPDDHIYLVLGNHAWVQIGDGLAPNATRLASNSPLRRWPTGGMGADQGHSGSTEDVLLPRHNDGRGHAANILAPGGTIWRFDLDGKNPALVAAGFRNQFDAAFNPEGELFSFDSDMEWDENLPWYRPVRVVHAVPGAEFGWRTGSSKIPAYALDTLPPIVETGRGSPVGMEWYHHEAFPPKYRRLFCADWAIGTIFAIHLEKMGASYTATAERFCSGAPMNVTDLAVAPDGSMYFTAGGRATVGGVYRIVYEKSVGMKPHAAVQPLAAWSPTRAELKWSAPTPELIQGDLRSDDAFKRRRACEAAIRTGIEPRVDDLWPLLKGDRFERTAARLVLQRIDPGKWAGRIATEPSPEIVLEMIVALCKEGKADPYAEVIFDRLFALTIDDECSTHELTLRFLRCFQLTCFHTKKRPDAVKKLAEWCLKQLPPDQGGIPPKRPLVVRELAILVSHFAGVEKLLDPTTVVNRLLAEMMASRSDTIHYFYCLRLVHEGWTKHQKYPLLLYYENTKNWKGGHSMAPFLENIFKDYGPIFTEADRTLAIDPVQKLPHVASFFLKHTPPNKLPPVTQLLAMYERLHQNREVGDWRESLIAAIGSAKNGEPALRRIADLDPTQQPAIARLLLANPSPENHPYLLKGLGETRLPLYILDLYTALKKSPIKPTISKEPKLEEAEPFRNVLVTAGRIDVARRFEAVQLLHHWTDRRFTLETDDSTAELEAWSKWYHQTWPTAQPLPDVADLVGASKWNLDELLTFLEKQAKGDPLRGRVLFEKANCVKCHKFGVLGEGLGPDLSALKGRFTRRDTLEAILFPSKVISDQYRGSVISTTSGKIYTGLAAPQGDVITVLQLDGSKVTLKKGDVEDMLASTTSPMPEKLLDELTREQIADLFAFLEGPPPK